MHPKNEAKILTFISEEFYFLSHRKELLEGMVDKGYEVKLVTRLAQGHVADENARIPMIDVDIERKNTSLFGFVRKVICYRNIIEKERPDCNFAVSLKPIMILALARKLCSKVPALYAVTGLGVTFSNHAGSLRIAVLRRFIEIYFRFVLNDRHSFVLFQNFDDRKMFVQKRWCAPERAFVISGAGVDLNRYSQKEWTSGGPLRFIFVGRLLWDKGIRFIVEACCQLRALRLEFEFLLAGFVDRENPAAVPQEYLEQQQREGLVKWLGCRDDIPALLNSADCFVFPSVYREGVPKVLLEASAAGLPMITTNVPGCRDVVTNGFNGFLVPPSDSKSLAAAMERVIQSRHKLPEWGRNARARAEDRYGIDRVIEEHMKVFRTVLSSTIAEC